MHSEMQKNFEENHSSYQDSDMKTKLTQDFYNQLNFTNSSQEFHEEDPVDKGSTENEEEEEFSFTCGGADASPIAAEEAFFNGQIKPIFPLFDRDFFSTTQDESDALHENLPTKPPVKKFFVQTKDSVESTLENAGDDAYRDRADRKAVEVSPEVCKKSNSTGFSKIWRFKDFLGRSNSDGRDAFVFLNDNSHGAAVSEKVERKVAANKVKKGKTACLSAHEVYLRRKAKDGDKRRSYLPYRPELMGFFTNVNSGFSKNLHPY